jgi:glucokinase
MKYVIALDIGGTNLRTALINDQYQLLKVDIQATPLQDLKAFLAAVQVGIDRVLKDFHGAIHAIACGVPGRVDVLGGIDILPNIGITKVPLKAFLQQTYHLPVIIKNDAVMAAVAEGNLGFGKTLASSYFITISTGIGAAFVANQTLAHSSEEVGHMLVPFKQGFEELEKVASGQGIVNLAAHYGVTIPDAKTLFTRYGEKDPLVLPIFQHWLSYITEFLKWVDRYYAPKAFILTGGVMKSKAYFWETLQQAVPHIPLALAQFGQDAGLIGAANLALLYR